MSNDYIIYKGRDGLRKITVINNPPYYCSTGKNSSHTGRWYPFLGIQVHFGYIHPETAKLAETTLKQFQKFENSHRGFILKGSYIHGILIPESLADSEKNRVVVNKENLLNTLRLGEGILSSQRL